MKSCKNKSHNILASSTRLVGFQLVLLNHRVYTRTGSQIPNAWRIFLQDDHAGCVEYASVYDRSAPH